MYVCGRNESQRAVDRSVEVIQRTQARGSIPVGRLQTKSSCQSTVGEGVDEPRRGIQFQKQERGLRHRVAVRR